MAKPTLRAVEPDDQPTPEQAWLASYRREMALLDQAQAERASRQALKPDVMRNLSLWGMGDQMLARELERRDG